MGIWEIREDAERERREWQARIEELRAQVEEEAMRRHRDGGGQPVVGVSMV